MSAASPLIDVIAGARPNFVKVAPILAALEAHRTGGGRLRRRLVQTGQHSDPRMSAGFVAGLGLPPADVELGADAGSPAEQTGAIMTRYERLLLSEPCDLCLVVGDVNSTLACALSAAKLNIPVAHVEAGLRSGDRSMPEEVNRLAVDAVSSWFFTTTRGAGDNLIRSGVARERIFFVGNTMIDTLVANADRLRPPPFWDEHGLRAGDYLLLTLHRPANVDDRVVIARLLEAVAAGAGGRRIVFPVHPRTRRSIRAAGSLPANLTLVEPQPYLEFNHLLRHARAVVTDSGGVSEEATALGLPCLTLRDSTERPETVAVGTNELVGTDAATIARALARVFAGCWKKGGIPERWDGQSAARIVAVLGRIA